MTGRAVIAALGVVACCLVAPHRAASQNRGVYPLGMTALSSGALPDTSLTYANQFLEYSRNRAKDNNGHTEPVTGTNWVRMDMNTFTWVSPWSAKGWRYAASATLPFASNSLTSDLKGPVSAGRGFADSYYIPLILGRNGERADVRVQYGFLAPTGRFSADANNNVGSGYWTHALSSGQTIQLATERRLTLSTFEMYELHTEQRGTNVRPGDTFDFDGSLMVAVPSGGTARLQAGAVWYAQRQATGAAGSGVDAESVGDRYAVNALGLAVSTAFPRQRASLAIKLFREFANRSTFEGYSLQVFGAITR